MAKGIVKLPPKADQPMAENNIRQRNDDYWYLGWYSDLVEIFFTNAGKMDKYNPETIRDFYAAGLTPEETYKELLSELTIEDDDNE